MVHRLWNEDAMTMSSRPYRSLAALVRRAREARGLNQRQLSRALRRSEGYVGHLESGKTRPQPHTLKALSSVLGLSYGELAIEAGYITGEEFENPLAERELARLNEIRDLTDEEFESAMDFVRYVRTRRGGNPGQGGPPRI